MFSTFPCCIPIFKSAELHICLFLLGVAGKLKLCARGKTCTAYAAPDHVNLEPNSRNTRKSVLFRLDTSGREIRETTGIKFLNVYPNLVKFWPNYVFEGGFHCEDIIGLAPVWSLLQMPNGERGGCCDSLGNKLLLFESDLPSPSRVVDDTDR